MSELAKHNPSDVVAHGVGLVLPRIGGIACQVAFFIRPQEESPSLTKPEIWKIATSAVISIESIQNIPGVQVSRLLITKAAAFVDQQP